MIGRIGADATNHAFADGTRVINFAIADTVKWHDRNTGEEKERTKWVQCSIFRKQDQSVNFAAYLKQGERVYIEGKIEATSYQDQNGQFKTGLKCNVDTWEILFDRKTAEQQNAVE